MNFSLYALKCGITSRISNIRIVNITTFESNELIAWALIWSGFSVISMPWVLFLPSLISWYSYSSSPGVVSEAAELVDPCTLLDKIVMFQRFVEFSRNCKLFDFIVTVATSLKHGESFSFWITEFSFLGSFCYVFTWSHLPNCWY